MNVRLKTGRLLLATTTLLALAACADTRDALGLTNRPPDEFAVVEQAPLSQPPDFFLKPPRPGAAPLQSAGDPSTVAAKALYGNADAVNNPALGVNNINTANLSGGEQALIAQTGAAKADPGIRTTVDKESTQQVVGSRKLINDLLFWKPAPQNGAVLNADAERQRLDAARAKGQPAISGGTTAIDHGKSAVLQ